MTVNDLSAGAMPVADGAMPSQSYPTGSVFAAYRLPYPGTTGARDAGVCFEGEPAGGATPPAGDPPPTPPAGDPPAAPPTPPATGDPADLGDAGKRAIEAERARAKAAEDRAKAAERERDELKAKTQTDQEKALDEAKKAGRDEVLTRVHAQVRRSEVRAALASAGINASVMDLATKADEFAALEVNDDGDVVGLPEAIEAFKKARADLFKPATPAGSADGGTRSGDKEPAKDLTSALEKHYAPRG